jgi:hypothetical protein
MLTLKIPKHLSFQHERPVITRTVSILCDCIRRCWRPLFGRCAILWLDFFVSFEFHLTFTSCKR